MCMSATLNLTPVLSADPLAMRTIGWEDYDLIDSGHGRKLERYGQFLVNRPEAQCLWPPALTDAEWAKADATFEPSDEEDAGRWRFTRPLPETWPLSWGPARFHARFTAFRHLAFFPEQAANWSWIQAQVQRMSGAPKILNLFGYTGVASLVAAAQGASVTHVDASKKAVAWARDNAERSGQSDLPLEEGADGRVLE